MANSAGEGNDACDTESEIVLDDGSEMAVENRNIKIEEAKQRESDRLAQKISREHI